MNWKVQISHVDKYCYFSWRLLLFPITSTSKNGSCCINRNERLLPINLAIGWISWKWMTIYNSRILLYDLKIPYNNEIIFSLFEITYEEKLKEEHKIEFNRVFRNRMWIARLSLGSKPITSIHHYKYISDTIIRQERWNHFWGEYALC